MGDWRRGSQRQQHRGRGGGGGYYEGGGRRGRGRGGEASSTPSSWKLLPPSGSRQPSVPSWEKEFCFKVGRIPWKNVIEAKESMPIFKNIAEWDDSAGEEAFHNAKARYWAQINRRPCNNFPLPDPDMYIDKIDWNCKVDPQMVADLEVRVEPPTNDECKSDHLRSGWESRLADEPIVPTGWVSAEDHTDNKAEAPAATGWDDWGNGKIDANNSKWDKGTGWDDVGVANKDGQWGNWESDSGWGKNAAEQRLDRWKSDADNYYTETRRNNKREGNVGGWHGSRNPRYGYKGGEGYHQGGGDSWRNCRGRRRVVS